MKEKHECHACKVVEELPALISPREITLLIIFVAYTLIFFFIVLGQFDSWKDPDESVLYFLFSVGITLGYFRHLYYMDWGRRLFTFRYAVDHRIHTHTVRPEWEDIEGNYVLLTNRRSVQLQDQAPRLLTRKETLSFIRMSLRSDRTGMMVRVSSESVNSFSGTIYGRVADILEIIEMADPCLEDWLLALFKNAGTLKVVENRWERDRYRLEHLGLQCVRIIGWMDDARETIGRSKYASAFRTRLLEALSSPAYEDDNAVGRLEQWMTIAFPAPKELVEEESAAAVE